MTSFAQHLSLALNAEHIWAIIINGFAKHIGQHHGELRHNVVSHRDTKEIEIREDKIVRRKTFPEDWEKLIFPRFLEGMKHHIANEF